MYLLLGLVVLYVLVLVAGCHLQERFIFFPEKLSKDYNFNVASPDTEIVMHTTDGADVNGLLYRRPGNKYIAIYFHGNAGSLASWKTVSDELLNLSCDALLIDYRTYGKSTGKLSEKGLYEDAEAAYTFAKSKGYTDAQIIFYGRSLGTGIATEMALRHPHAHALILETPYTSVPDRAQEIYPVLLPKLYLKYHLDNLQKASKIVMPTLVIHGTKDTTIPYHHGKEVFERLGCQKQLITIEGGTHNDLSRYPEHRSGIQAFLNSL